jgi:DNA-binding NarL/FixJ family response regulator
MIRVVIADDHPVVRQGIRQILSANHDVVVVAEAATGTELARQLSTVECDVILLDLSMPGSDGLELLKTLRRDWPRIPVLVLTMYSEEQFAVRTLKAGASGYLTKDSRRPSWWARSTRSWPAAATSRRLRRSGSSMSWAAIGLGDRKTACRIVNFRCSG